MTITKRHVSRRATRALSKASLTCAAALSAAAGLGSQTAVASHINYDISALALDEARFPGHTSPTGGQFSVVNDMNAFGQLIGNQTFYNTTATNDDPAQTPRYGQSSWFHGAGGITQVGFVTDVHRDSDTNYHSTNATQLNNQGYVAGHSVRFLEGAGVQTAGQSAWLYRNGEQQRIGLFGSDIYERFVDRGVDGVGVEALSTVVKLNNPVGNAASHVVGTSALFRGGSGAAALNDAGTASWIHIGGVSGSSSTRIGPVDDVHTQTDSDDSGYTFQVSTVGHLNDVGTAGGVANRYSRTARIADGRGIQIGQSAWLQTADSAEAKIVGFQDALHQGTNGTRVSSIVALNNNNVAVGHSNRYDPTTGAAREQSAWMQSATDDAPIALGYAEDADTVHKASNGARRSVVLGLNDAGHAMGYSMRYNGAAVSGTAGRTAWVQSVANGRERAGLFDEEEHTGPNGFQSSTPEFLSAAGHAAGTSRRYLLAGDPETKQARGESAWLHTRVPGSAGTSVRVGLYKDSFAAAHTRDDGTQNSTVEGLNDNGIAVGHSSRYLPGQTANAGQSAWISDGTTNRQLGLTDPNYRRANGYQYSEVQFLNELGQAAGYATRYNQNDAGDSGQTGWFYAPGEVAPIPLAFDESNQENFTDIRFLSEDGVVLGVYTDYVGTDERTRGFYWNYNLPEAERFHDLGELAASDPDSVNWQALNQALEISDSGHILGIGTMDGRSMPFLLTPVPEPTGIALVALTGLALLPRRRRR